jgi:hypothetical protein
MIEEMAGPLLVRVEFDSRSSVHAVCADRTSAETWRRARTRVANNLGTITDTPPGPSCLAGSRLDFNRREAGRAAAHHAVSACLRKGEMVYQSNKKNPSNPDWADRMIGGRHFWNCLYRSQKALHQLWLLDPVDDTTVHVYHETPSSAPRRETIRACSEVEESGPALEACVKSHGWEP